MFMSWALCNRDDTRDATMMSCCPDCRRIRHGSGRLVVPPRDVGVCRMTNPLSPAPTTDIIGFVYICWQCFKLYFYLIFHLFCVPFTFMWVRFILFIFPVCCSDGIDFSLAIFLQVDCSYWELPQQRRLLTYGVIERHPAEKQRNLTGSNCMQTHLVHVLYCLRTILNSSYVSVGLNVRFMQVEDNGSREPRTATDFPSPIPFGAESSQNTS
jgi:hypothetical protein